MCVDKQCVPSLLWDCLPVSTVELLSWVQGLDQQCLFAASVLKMNCLAWEDTRGQQGSASRSQAVRCAEGEL